MAQVRLVEGNWVQFVADGAIEQPAQLQLVGSAQQHQDAVPVREQLRMRDSEFQPGVGGLGGLQAHGKIGPGHQAEAVTALQHVLDVSRC